jgi:citrate lyase subunit beta/citryl-CoA lyase
MTEVQGVWGLAEPQIIRSLVFLGGHDRDRIMRVAEAGPDAICIDLEDSTPRAAKQRARSQFREIAKEIDAAGPVVFVRTNAPDHGMDEDLRACMCPEVHCVSLPKVEHGDAVREFAVAVADEEARQGLPVGGTLIRPIIETAQGVRNAYEIGSASALVAYLGGVEGGIFGDLGGSIGYEQTDDGRETLFLRSKVLIDARAAGVPHPIGGGSTARKDAEGARMFARENRILGYDGVHCGTASDVIAAVNEEFTPRRADLEAWLEILPVLEAAEAEGLTVAHVGDTVYDLIGLVRVRSQLALARRLGMDV